MQTHTDPHVRRQLPRRDDQLARRFRAAVALAGFRSLADLAFELGVSGATMTRWAQGSITPRPEQQAVIATALGVPASYLWP